MNIRSLIILALAGGLSVACGSQTDQSASSSSAPTAAPTATSAPAAPALVKSADATINGKQTTILTDASGMTLYYFTPDKGGKVTCTGACAGAWPPVMVTAGTNPPASVTGFNDNFATVASPAGGNQLTYNGWPVYAYVGDKAPGDVKGQGVGGKWFAVTPALASATTASAGGSSVQNGY